MAKKQHSAETSNYTKGLNEDLSNLYQDTSSWTHARNAVNNTERGDLGYLGNEPSNKECIQAPYTIIGFIHLEADEWAIFSTDDTNSEIGFFKEGLCSYRTIVNAPCLNLKRTHLISGVSKTDATCGKVIYWADNLNPDRYLKIDDVPWIKTQIIDNQGCITYQNTSQLDCDKIRLESFVQQPCVRLEKGSGTGTLLNGSYFVVIGYTVNEQRVTDYSVPSNIIALFDNDNVAGSLKINFDSLDTVNYEEFELVIVSTVNQQTSARRVGYYSTRSTVLDIDLINNSWPSVPIELLPIRNEVYERSEAMYNINNYLLRVAPESKFSFNYQPLANQIQAKWVSVEYDQAYYKNSGTNVGYMRDETYAFFIRWVYATGDRSVSYHIPGRVKTINDVNLSGDTSIPSDGTGPFERWQLTNTALTTAFPNTLLQDGGLVIAEGDMGYWESSEKYPDDNPEVWNADIIGQPQYDLCNQHIRHHKFPDNFLHPTTSHFNNNKIRIMGVKFNNVQPPVDLNGQPIPGIVGYEILRGSRDGQKTILAKGVINNMFGYNVVNKLTNRTGFYPNYPFNDLSPDPYISSVNHITTNVNPIPNNAVSRNRLTFHSPETTFNNPFLSTRELKLYGVVSGQGLSKVQHPEDHPSHKLITNATFILSIFIGVGNALANARGKRKISYTPGYASNFGAPTVDGSSAVQTAFATAINTANIIRYNLLATNALNVTSELAVFGGLAAAQTTDVTTAATADTPFTALGISPGTVGLQVFQESEETDFSTLSIISKTIAGINMSYAYIGQGSDAFIDLILALSPFRQYALQRIAYAQYSNHHSYTTPLKHRRHEINQAAYLKSHIHDFGNNDVINNINRSRTVAIQTTSNIDNPHSISTAPVDNSRVHPNTNIHNIVRDSIKTSFNTSVHYAALKNRIVNQYGQLESIIQLPVTTCVIDKSETASPVLFNGDTYIGRFTEKNNFHYFYDWLFKQPDGTNYNYKDFQNVPYPMYYADLSDYDFSDFTSSLSNIFSSGTALDLPGNRHNLHSSGFTGLFTRKNSYFYLFNSGVRDFFVESEYNIDFRPYGDKEEERHYDYTSYQDLETIFRTRNIKAGNYAKFDISVNISRLYSNAITWGNTHVRNYNPTIYESCYTKWEKRVLYSLPSFTEQRKDNWLVFLTNNYKDFSSRVTSIKPVGKSGAMFFFQNESPVQVQGVDTLQTDTGVKLTIGDGGLFTQPLQNIVNADTPYEYGSCQNRLAPINTSSGLFWISQNQGKIFMFAGGLKEVSGQNLKWWLADFLPYQLTKAFPNYDLLDNPVVGIGCQSAYDNTNNVVYFSKKDYLLRDDVDPTRITYIGNGLFSYAGQFTFETGDTRFFIDASWTISLDAKSGEWISYHDWFPDLTMPTKDHFLTTKRNGLWKHNEEFNSYCNFYGLDYPFEVEYILSTGQQVNTLRSVEYFLEVYKYAQNGIDRFHVLDFNFDEAVIHNSEQCSGVLRLNLKPKNDILSSLQYPIVNFNSIDILYSKEEHKYRFNQFWDITDDRGEFNINAQRHIWNTEPNGFRKSLNFNNLNYAKNEFERKKFRHYSTAVFLKRNVSGDRKMLVLLTNNKSQASHR